MRNIPVQIYWVVLGLALSLAAPAWSAEANSAEGSDPLTNPVAAAEPPLAQPPAEAPVPQVSAAEMRELFSAYLQLQQQLHDALLAIEQNRREAADNSSRGTESVTASLRRLEESFSKQRQQDLRFLENSNRSVIALAGVFAGSALLALVAAAWLQLRAINRLATVAATLPAAQLLPHSTTTTLGLSEPEPAEDATSTRLRLAVETLENRIRELEHTANAHHNGEGKATLEQGPEADRASMLLGKGQALLNLNDLEGALNCFDGALSEDPGNTDALIKKGTALERLRRLEEAIQCYDRAIELNRSSALAYLYKGGVYNQLERFNEALECYEQALRAQQGIEVSNQ